MNNPQGDSQFEFLEFTNSGSSPLDLTGIQIWIDGTELILLRVRVRVRAWICLLGLGFGFRNSLLGFGFGFGGFELGLGFWLG